MIPLLLSAQTGAVPEMRLMRFPTVHGDTVVFTYASDLWVTTLNGGTARRLTSHPGDEVRARISPDGKSIAFTAAYDGNNDVYVMPIEGGEPKRLTFEPEGDNVNGWTPDGKITYTSSYGSHNARQPRLWMIDPKGGMSIRTPIAEAQDGSFTSDGRTYVYNRTAAHNRNWRMYRGGTQGKISFFELSTLKYWEKPTGKENSWFPMTVGNAVYYVSDKTGGTVNLYRYEPDTKKDVALTKFTDADIKWPSTDGKTIVFEKNGYLHGFDIGSGQVKRIDPELRSDFVAARRSLRKLGSSIDSLSLSPSGVRVAATARGELFSIPVKQGDTRNLSQSMTSRERFASWSPDGKSIAYISDETGDYQIYVRPQLDGDARQVGTHQGASITGIRWSPDSKTISLTTDDNRLMLMDVASGRETLVHRSDFSGAGDYDWSPDSKWIVFSKAVKNRLNALHLYDVVAGKVTQISDGFYSDGQPRFDLNGKYLYFISQRTFGPTQGFYELSLAVIDGQRIYVLPLADDVENPLTSQSDEEGAAPPERAEAGRDVRVVLEGISDRAVALPMPASGYGGLAGANNGCFYVKDGALNKFDLRTKQNSVVLASVGGQFTMNAARTKAAYSQGGQISVADLGSPAPATKVDVSAVEALVDPKAEWKQMLWDTWRYQRDNFYDKDMVGLNWLAIGKKYEAYLPYVTHRSDMTYVLGLMIGELGTSHAYVQGGETLDNSEPVTVGTLGADYEVANGKVRFKKIYRGLNFEEQRRGPLGEPGVKVSEGDYLLEIDGEPVSAGTNPHAMLVGKSGRYVTLTVNSQPNTTGARKVRVRTIGSESQLRYAEWVKDTRKRVSELSGGRIGYMHIPDTGGGGMTEFAKGYWSQTDKDAMVVDERWNGGGFIQPWFVDTLARRTYAGIQNRNTLDSQDMVAIPGPKAILINEYSGSGGDFFPWMFKHAKLGPAIGTTTVGGLVGISGYFNLIDGGQVSSPEFAFYDLETGEWIAENVGTTPDIPVDARPDLIAQGRDPQLEAAVDYLMKELAKQKPGNFRRADFPKVKTGGG